jgi:hypothetical protein
MNEQTPVVAIRLLKRGAEEFAAYPVGEPVLPLASVTQIIVGQLSAIIRNRSSLSRNDSSDSRCSVMSLATPKRVESSLLNVVVQSNSLYEPFLQR